MTQLLVLAALALAPAVPQDRKAPADQPALAVAHGVVDKADKDALTLKPRDAGERFAKAVTLKLTGTSKVAVLAPQTRGGKTVLTQREGSAADLAVGQEVAVIYAEAGKDGPVLLSAVAQPAGK